MSKNHFPAICVVLALSIAAAGAEALPNQSAAATTPTNVARVYVQTAKGVIVYTTSSTGKLTMVSGSPFKNTVGLMIGAPGGHFITLGTTYRSYAIKPTGGIGAQVAQINTSLYQVRRNAALPLPMGHDRPHWHRGLHPIGWVRDLSQLADL